MVEEADLGDIGDFLSGLTGDITSAYKTFNQPSNVPVPGSQADGRPDLHVTGGAVKTQTDFSTLLLVAAVAALGVAFVMAVRK